MPGLRIAISGSTGLVGRAATADLAAAGHAVVPLVRGRNWDPATGELDRESLGAVDAVLHLAGENIARGRWTAAKRRRIAESRGPVTERLCRALGAMPRRPHVLISASAVGIYGDRGDAVLDERSPPGEGFVADVVRAWEAATAPARDAGLRVVHLRLGMVLDPAGGALQRMLPPFRLGVGGRLGHGRQWVSWIALGDLVRIVQFVLAREDLAGPVLAVAPEPVTNAQFTRELGRALRRPAVLPVPRLALRAVFGAMADELLLASQRCQPRELDRAGFPYLHRSIASAFAAMVARGS